MCFLSSSIHQNPVQQPPQAWNIFSDPLSSYLRSELTDPLLNFFLWNQRIIFPGDPRWTFWWNLIKGDRRFDNNDEKYTPNLKKTKRLNIVSKSIDFEPICLWLNLREVKSINKKYITRNFHIPLINKCEREILKFPVPYFLFVQKYRKIKNILIFIY